GFEAERQKILKTHSEARIAKVLATLKSQQEAYEQAKVQAENEMAFLRLAALIFDIAAKRNNNNSGSIILLIQAARVAQLQAQADARLKDQDARLLEAQKTELAKIEKSWDEAVATLLDQFKIKTSTVSLGGP
ncbi:MAG: hypothetical protein AB1405_00495, partial [Bdellovibrionota bacterium]